MGRTVVVDDRKTDMNTSCCYMNFCKSSDTEKVGVKLNFSRKELLYDIQNYAYIEGHVMGEENQHAQHTLVDIAEEGNVDRVSRILSLTHAEAVELLYPYTKEEPIGEEVNDMLEAPDTYVIDMEVPKTMSRTTITLLSRLIHEYMVYKVLHDWLSITNPKAANNWLEKSEQAEKRINTIKHLRTSAFTRDLRTPF